MSGPKPFDRLVSLVESATKALYAAKNCDEHVKNHTVSARSIKIGDEYGHENYLSATQIAWARKAREIVSAQAKAHGERMRDKALTDAADSLDALRREIVALSCAVSADLSERAKQFRELAAKHRQGARS